MASTSTQSAQLSVAPPPRTGAARWKRFWEHRETGTSLALFRIGTGFTVLYSIGGAVWCGVAPVVWLNEADGGYRAFSDPPWLFQLLGGLTPLALWSMIAVCLLSGGCLMMGLGGRLAAAVTLATYLAISDVNWHASGWDDILIFNALWLLVLGRSTATLSLDCRLSRGAWTSTEPIAAWPRRIAVYQLVLMYFMTGIQKISILWTPSGDFAALYYCLQEPSWQRFDMRWLARVYPLTQIATATVWLWEWSSPLLLLDLHYRRTRERPGRLRRLFLKLNFRRWWVLLGVFMHLGIFVFIGLGPFTWMALSFYFCLYRPEEWERSAHWFAGKFFASNGLTSKASLASVREGAEPPSDCRSFAAWRRVPLHLFVVYHLAAITLASLPDPRVPSEAERQNPLFAEEFASWSERLNGWGLETTPQGLANWAWNTAAGYNRIRDKILTPFKPYFEYFGPRQGWHMFAGANLYPSRLVVDIEERGAWRTLFAESRPEFSWRKSQLAHEHIRGGLYCMAFLEEDDDNFQGFARWVAQQAASDFPQARRVRVTLFKFRSPSPEEVRGGQAPLEAAHRQAVFPLEPK